MLCLVQLFHGYNRACLPARQGKTWKNTPNKSGASIQRAGTKELAAAVRPMNFHGPPVHSAPNSTKGSFSKLHFLEEVAPLVHLHLLHLLHGSTKQTK